MSTENPNADPLEFLKGMWGSMGFAVPGMVTPTLDVNEIDKRITDLKTVEGWLRMNLNMLQMSIQGLDMQRAALAAVKAMSQQAQQAGEGATDNASNPFASAAAIAARTPSSGWGISLSARSSRQTTRLRSPSASGRAMRALTGVTR